MKEIVNSLTIRHQRVFYLVGHSDVNLTIGGWIVVALTGNMVDKAFQSSLYIGRNCDRRFLPRFPPPGIDFVVDLVYYIEFD